MLYTCHNVCDSKVQNKPAMHCTHSLPSPDCIHVPQECWYIAGALQSNVPDVHDPCYIK